MKRRNPGIRDIIRKRVAFVRGTNLAARGLLCLMAISLSGCRGGGGLETLQTGGEMTIVTPELRALAERAEAVMTPAKGTPGQEFAGRLNNPPIQRIIKSLRTQNQVPAASLSPYLMNDLKGSLEKAEAGVSWPQPPAIVVPKAATAPVMDGLLEEEVWKTAATFTDVIPFNQPTGTGPATTWRLLWDENFLYVAWDCRDTDLIAPVRDRDSAVYEDDCVEIFLLPEFRFRTYWELIISPSGSIYDSVQCKNPDGWGSNQDTSQTLEGLQIGIQLQGTLNQSDDVDSGYTVEIAIPFNQLPGYSHAAPKGGETLHFVLVRLDKNANQALKPYAFIPLLGWGHNIWNHARMTLAP